MGGVAPPTFEVETLDVHTGIADLGDFATSEEASLPALDVALERPGRRLPVANLLPEELRPRPFPWPLAATAALALLTLGIGAAIPTVAFVRSGVRWPPWRPALLASLPRCSGPSGLPLTWSVPDAN